MSIELLASLRTGYPSYTAVERDIADFVLSNSDEVVHMPIAELASRCSVGQTSVIRFCRRLGQSGYHGFRLALAAALEAQRLLLPAIAPSSNFLDGVMDRQYQKHSMALNGTRHMLSAQALQEVVEHLAQARHICLFGLESAMPGALAAQQAFAGCLWKCCYAMDSQTQRSYAMALTCDDAALFYSCTGREECMLAMAEEAGKAAAYSVAVTCDGGSPLVALCDASLCCCGGGSNPSSPPLDRLTAQTAFAFMTQTLCSGCVEWLNRTREE